MPTPESPSSRLSLVVYLCLMLIAVGLLLTGPTPGSMWVSSAAGVLYSPFRMVSAGARRIGDFFAEGDRMRVETLELRRLRTSMEEVQEENTQLRDQLGFSRRDTLHLVPAWVLAKRPDRMGTRVLLNRGELNGVHPGDPVVTRDGLAGRVDAVEAHVARVRLLADRSSAVSARVRRSSVDGIVEGSPVEGLWLRFVPTSADVRLGDVIVTSGLGGAFPEGIPVGTVAGLGIEEGGLLRRIRVRPAAPSETLEDVFVLAPGDSARQWGFLWSIPEPPVDSLGRSMAGDGIAP